MAFEQVPRIRLTDGAVLPILHLNGYKIANPTVLARITREELEQLLRGYGWTPYFVAGHEPEPMHEAMAATLDAARRAESRDPAATPASTATRAAALADDRARLAQGLDRAESRSTACRSKARSVRTRCRSPIDAANPEHLRQLEDWLRSYRPEELFDEQGRLIPELAELAPTGERRMGANPHANGGILLRDLRMPDFRDYAVAVPSPGAVPASATRACSGAFLRDVMKLNKEQRNFRIFGPDETISNGLEAVFEATNRQWEAATVPNDELSLRPTGA